MQPRHQFLLPNDFASTAASAAPTPPSPPPPNLPWSSRLQRRKGKKKPPLRPYAGPPTQPRRGPLSSSLAASLPSAFLCLHRPLRFFYCGGMWARKGRKDCSTENPGKQEVAEPVGSRWGHQWWQLRPTPWNGSSSSPVTLSCFGYAFPL